MILWFHLAALDAQAQEPATDPARAKELYENGAELYAEGLYEEAILAWQEGYGLSQLPDFLFNIAGAQERLGKWRAALDTLSKYRAYASAEERETLARRIRNLEERLAEEGDKPVVPAPVPGPSPQPAPVGPTPRERSLEPVVVGTLFGIGGVGLVTGLVTGLGSAAAGNAAEAQCVTGAGGGLLCPATVSGDLDQERSRALVADMAYGLGAASLLGGVAVLVIPSGKSKGTTRIGLGPDSVVVSFVR